MCFFFYKARLETPSTSKNIDLESDLHDKFWLERDIVDWERWYLYMLDACGSDPWPYIVHTCITSDILIDQADSRPNIGTTIPVTLIML